MSDTSSQDAYTYEASFGDYFALLKPRVMSLVVFTAFVGYFVAPTNLHPFEGFVAILAIALGAGASGALNMWYDADIDSVMKRTRGRPVPSGRVTGEEARIIGITLSAFSVVFLGLAANWVAAGLLAFTDLFLRRCLHNVSQARDAAEHRDWWGCGCLPSDGGMGRGHGQL
jgi:protoheme IX farnesyltransferase